VSEPLAAQLASMQAMAQRAGDLLLAHCGAVTGLDRKAGTELVSDIDRRSEELLLTEIRRLFPDDAIEAEEGGASAGASGRTWYIDPLDGTTNYVHGHPFFAVSLAVADAGVPLLGVVYAPYLDQLFVAGRGGGARLLRPRAGEERRLPPRGDVGLTESLLATGFPYIRDARVDRNLAAIGRFLHGGCHGIRRCGSAAIDLAHTAAGLLDGFWEFGLRPWDTAAGTVIARETGCNVTALDGSAPPLPAAEVLAAPPGLHARMLTLLASRTPDRSDVES
jgi:myo-inositol-1(or 4)-monophosphatase